MRLEDLKALKSVTTRVYIENNIAGRTKTSVTAAGGIKRVFEPFTDSPMWSEWRIGFETRHNGSPVVIWCRGYRPTKDSPKALWSLDFVHNCHTGKKMRSDGADKLFYKLLTKGKLKSFDTSDVIATKQKEVDYCGELETHWKIDYNGIEWLFRRSRGTFYIHANGSLVWCVNSVRAGKKWIKYDSQERLEKYGVTPAHNVL